MTEFIINMSTEDKSDIYPLVNIRLVSPIENKNTNEVIKTLKEYYFFSFSPYHMKANSPYYGGPYQLVVLKQIFKYFMVYEESQQIIINTCSIKPVDLYINTLKKLLAALKADNPNWDSSNPLLKNTANVVMNGVLEMDYVGTILDSASKEARLAFATWTNPTYLIGN